MANFYKIIVGIIFAAMPLVGSIVHAEESDSAFTKAKHLPWHTAPEILNVGPVVRMTPGPNLAFLDPKATSELLILNGNPADESAYAIAPKDLKWWSLAFYQSNGHVKDDEHLDPDALLNALKQNAKNGAQKRRNAGLLPIVVLGWSVLPHYD